MKIFLTGASGLLGRAVYERFLGESDWTVCGISFKRQVIQKTVVEYPILWLCCYGGKSIKHQFKNDFALNIKLISRTSVGLTKLNLLDKDSVTNLLHTVCPDVIVHCAAERFPDKVEKDPQAAYDLNVGVSAHLADVASNHLHFLNNELVLSILIPKYMTPMKN